MFENLKRTIKYLITEKLHYRIKNWLYAGYRLVRSFPTIIKIIFKDLSKVGIIGSVISLDTSSICQLKCPKCPTLDNNNYQSILESGFLKFKNFKRFIDNNPDIKTIELANWGEIFLNPEFKKFLEYAYLKKVNLKAGTGANLNNVSTDILESLVRYNFKFLTVSLDGATNETYRIYRIGGNFDEVLNNIKIINSFKKKYHSEYPKLLWQFIIFGHNEHEILAARKMAKDLGMSFYAKLNRVPSYSPIKNKEAIRKDSGLGVATRNEFIKRHQRRYMNYCRRLWDSPQINWDGKLLGCSINLWEDFGNIYETSLQECLNSEKYILTKQVILGKKKAEHNIPCLKCPLFKTIERNPLKKIDFIFNLDIHTIFN